MDATSFIHDSLEMPLKYRIFCLLNDITEQPMCAECNTNPVSFDPGKKRFLTFCSTKCAMKNEQTKNNRKNTCIDRYGATTNLSVLSEESKKINAAKGAEALKECLFQKYGVSNPMEIFYVKEKHKESANRDDVKKRKKETLRNNSLMAQGVDHFSQNNISNYVHYNDRDFILKTFVDSNNHFLFQQFMDYFNICFSSAHKKKKEMGIEEPNVNNWKYGKKQIEVFNYIKSIYDGQILQNTRSTIAPKELDIYIPEKKLGIEFNGLYWHSNLDKRDYHLKKTLMCEENGIQLFHIFENEWDDPTKRSIWMSMIKNKLGLNERRIGARDCVIRTITSDISRAFLNENHLQGADKSSFRFGLFHKKTDELLSLMTLSKSRYNKSFDFEVVRFCNKKFVTVIGSFSKLLTHFRKNHLNSSIVSYGNRRWTSANSNIYKSNNASLISFTDPNYFYFRNKVNGIYRLESRMKFQKHRLKDVLESFDETLSERQNCLNNGYRVIYDSGNIKYLFYK